MITDTEVIASTFEEEILFGLKQKQKRLSSKYFYDEKGDKLFQEIMKMDEYYLTRSEYEIFTTQKEEILKVLTSGEKIQLVEFGAGDGFKTKVLLQHLIDGKVDFEYVPIDISVSVLKQLKADLEIVMPELEVKSVAMTYFEALRSLNSKTKKMVLFLGSNIGNFMEEEAVSFLQQANDAMNEGDYFLLGIDLKKDPSIVLDAYNDKQGITKAFNLNLLERINRELKANFDLSQFQHFPTYDPETGETKSYLISKRDQTVHFENRGEDIHFKYAEPIFMEVSKKYSSEEVESLAKQSNFKIQEHFYDCKHYYTNSLWKK